MVPSTVRRSICKSKGSAPTRGVGKVLQASGAARARFESLSNSPPRVLILAPSLDGDLTSVELKAEFTALCVGQNSTGLQPCASRSRARGSERQLEQLENIFSPAEIGARALFLASSKALLWQAPKPLFHPNLCFLMKDPHSSNTRQE